MGTNHKNTNPKKKWRRRCLPSALIATLLLFSACATERPFTEARAIDAPTAVFAAGYGGIIAKYIEQKTAGELALKALQGLSAVDPAFKVEARGNLLRLSQGDRLLRVGVAPAPRNLDGWASLSADFLAVSLANLSPDIEADEDAFMAVMFDRVLGSLDEYSRYAGARLALRQREKRKGYSGVGLQVHDFEGAFLVTDVIPDSPAKKAGIQPSDEILKINDFSVEGLDIAGVFRRLRGPVSSKLALVLRRPNVPDPIEVTLYRQHVFAPTVEYKRRDSIAYFQLSGFNRNTARILTRHLHKAEKTINPPLQGIVLDLRGNPGGLMDQAIAVADHFLESDGIIYTRGRHSNSSQIYNAVAGDIGNGLPIVILLNGKSASSAEIVAGALQDRHRALVVGSRSYGKGTVQTILPLPNGAEITLTWSLIYTPSGGTLNKIGILPDVCTAGLKGKASSLLREMVSKRHTSPERARKADCPPLRTESPLDLFIAEGLLGNTALYASLLKEKREEIADKERLSPED